MDNFNSINLNLYQPIVYNKESLLQTQAMEDVYQLILKKIDNSDIASEACIKFKYKSSDSIDFQIAEVGFALPPSQEVVDAIKEANTIPLDSYDMEIKPGKYKFIQLPFLPTNENLFSTLMQATCANTFTNSGYIYLRLLKENAIVVLAQIIIELEK